MAKKNPTSINAVINLIIDSNVKALNIVEHRIQAEIPIAIAIGITIGQLSQLGIILLHVLIGNFPQLLLPEPNIDILALVHNSIFVNFILDFLHEK